MLAFSRLWGSQPGILFTFGGPHGALRPTSRLTAKLRTRCLLPIVSAIIGICPGASFARLLVHAEPGQREASDRALQSGLTHQFRLTGSEMIIARERHPNGLNRLGDYRKG
jgi:hypothetical protein